MSLWDEDLESRFTSVRREDAMEQMLVVDERGHVHRGADAFPPIFRLLSGGALLRWPWLLPGGPALARIVYRWVARHRHELPGGAGACETPKGE